MEMKAVNASCQTLGITLQTVALLAFGKFLACIQGCRDVVFGHVVSGQSLPVPDIDLIIGPLLNTVPFRLMLNQTHKTQKMALSEIQRFSGESQEFQHASLGRIQAEWLLKAEDDNVSLFNALFIFQKTASKRMVEGSGLWTPVRVNYLLGRTEYPFNFEIEQAENEIVTRLVSHADGSDHDVLSSWLTLFDLIFKDILENPDRSVLAYPESLRTLPLVASKVGKSINDFTIAPGTDLERIKAALSEVSEITLDHIAPETSMFSLGLDSIAAIRVAAACRIKGVNLSVADVLQGRTLQGICRRFRADSLQRESQAFSRSAPISAKMRLDATLAIGARDEDVEDVIPCLGGQVYHLAYWLKSGHDLFETVWAFSCSNSMEEMRLSVAWRKLRERHSILRTAFVATSPETVLQIVFKSAVIDDSSFQVCHNIDDSDIAIPVQVARLAEDAFELFSPPVRLRLIKGHQDHILLKLHHASYDAWTVPQLLSDLDDFYHYFTLPPVPCFSSFVRHTEPFLGSEDSRKYWTRALKSCERTLLRPCSNDQSKSEFSTDQISIPSVSSLETSCSHLGISPPPLFILSFARVLANCTGVANPVLGLYQSGRSASFKGIEKVSGPCLNVLPIGVQGALSQEPIKALQKVLEDLGERVNFEQDDIRHIGDWMSWAGRPMFNGVLNILWEKEANSESVTNRLLTPLEIETGKTKTRKSGETCSQRTAIDKLDMSMFSRDNLFLDVRKDTTSDCVQLGIKCSEALMDEASLSGFIKDIKDEIESLTKVLGVAWC